MPASYRAPGRGPAKEKTYSQSVDRAVSETARVHHVLESKGGDVITILASDTIATAVTILRDKRIGALVVVNESGALEGILSERDIVRKLAETPGQTLPQTVAENMTPNVVTCTSQETLVTVLRRMSDGKFRHMPVVENGTLLGMVTIGDVVTFRLNELEHETLQLKQLIVG